MPRGIIVALALACVALGAVAGAAVAESITQTREVRIAAQRLANGRVEFALQERGEDGTWGERILPRRRFFPATGSGRWLASSPIELTLEVETVEPTPPIVDTPMTKRQQLRQSQWYLATFNNATTNFPLGNRYPGVASYCSMGPDSVEPDPLAIRGTMTGDDGGYAQGCLHEGGLMFITHSGRGQMNINLKIMTEPGHRWPSTSERKECPDTPYDPQWDGHGQVEWRLNGGLLHPAWHNHHPYSSGRTFNVGAIGHVHLLIDGLNTITARSCQVKYREYRGHRYFDGVTMVESTVTFRLDFDLLGWSE
jgi:hypothetical protein